VCTLALCRRARKARLLHSRRPPRVLQMELEGKKVPRSGQ
jgi:hypothetical protein